MAQDISALLAALLGDVPRPNGPDDQDPYNESPNMPPLMTEDDPHGYYDGGGGEGPSVMYQGMPTGDADLRALINAQTGSPYAGPDIRSLLEYVAKQAVPGGADQIYADREFSKELAADPVGNGPDPMLMEFIQAMSRQ